MVGGVKKRKDAELDDLRPVVSNWFNPLSNVIPQEKETMFSTANLVASQLNRSFCGKNGSSMAEEVGIDRFNVNEGVGIELGNDFEMLMQLVKIQVQ